LISHRSKREPHPSPISKQAVAEAIEREGFEVRKQVGVANFRLDLAIVDPANPGRYLLGVECDGATYHSAASARDRDRLRQQVLEDLGWRIHRVWSLDWLIDRDKELRRLLLAVEEARNDPTEEKPGQHGGNAEQTRTVVRTDEVRQPMPPHELISSVPYEKARIACPTAWYENSPPINAMVTVVTGVVAEESPVHLDEIVKRVAEVWGFGRAALGSEMPSC